MSRRGRSNSNRAPGPVALSAILDLNAAGPLAGEFLARRGGPLVMDGSAVERIGGQCLQVLLATRKTWEADGYSFQLTNPSVALTQALMTFGAESLANSQVAEGCAP